jgi:predicted membrane channel-forming protein YqfA (hemolysin III family)
MRRLKGYVVLYIAAALVAVMAFTKLITHVDEVMFSPFLAIAVFIALLGKYSESQYRKKHRP